MIFIGRFNFYLTIQQPLVLTCTIIYGIFTWGGMHNILLHKRTEVLNKVEQHYTSILYASNTHN